MSEFGRPKASTWVNIPERPPVQPLPQSEPSGSQGFSANEPVWVRLAWSDRPGEIEGVRVWNVNTQTYSSVRPTDRLAADVREAFARFVAEGIVAAAWPASGTGMGPSASSAELLNVTEELLSPRLLAAEVVRVIVQIAAVHAGIPPFVARMMGQAAGDLFTKLSSPAPGAPEVQAGQYVDLALSVEDGSLINIPALQQIAGAWTANAVDELLGPATPPSPSRGTSPSPSRGTPPSPSRGTPPNPSRAARPSRATPPSPSPGTPPSPSPGTPPSPSPATPPSPSPTDIARLGPGGFGV